MFQTNTRSRWNNRNWRFGRWKFSNKCPCGLNQWKLENTKKKHNCRSIHTSQMPIKFLWSIKTFTRAQWNSEIKLEQRYVQFHSEFRNKTGANINSIVMLILKGACQMQVSIEIFPQELSKPLRIPATGQETVSFQKNKG